MMIRLGPRSIHSCVGAPIHRPRNLVDNSFQKIQSEGPCGLRVLVARLVATPRPLRTFITRPSHGVWTRPSSTVLDSSLHTAQSKSRSCRVQRMHGAGEGFQPAPNTLPTIHDRMHQALKRVLASTATSPSAWTVTSPTQPGCGLPGWHRSSLTSSLDARCGLLTMPIPNIENRYLCSPSPLLAG